MKLRLKIKDINYMRIIGIFLVLALTLGGATLAIQTVNKSQAQMKSMFSWNSAAVEDKDMDEVLRQTGTGRLFQTMSQSMMETDTFNTFMKRMKDQKVSVYYLAGTPEWALTESADSLIKAIDAVDTWNSISDNYKIQGMVFDVEPYLLPDWEENQEKFMQNLVSTLKTAYGSAKEKGLHMVICVPYWYDKNHSGYLEQLIRDCCDEAAVMNYYKNKEYDNMINEVQFARTYNKSVTCIFEFVKPGQHGLTEKNSYYNQGIGAADKVFEEVYQGFNYPGLYCSYHYYAPVKEILKR